MKKLKLKTKIKLGKGTILVLVCAGILLVALIFLCVLIFIGKRDKARQLELMNTEITNTTLDTFRPSEKIINASPYENKIQFGNSVITLPCELRVLLEEGAQIADTSYTNSYLIPAGDAISLQMNLGGMNFTISVTNNSEETRKLYQCQVSELIDISYYYITFAGGIIPGKSTFDDVVNAWGSGAAGEKSSKNGMLSIMYYRDGIPAKDIYAYKDGGKGVSSASEIYDVGGYSYTVVYDRSSGIVNTISAKFNQKAGLDSYETITYQFKGVDVIFEILTDAYDIGNDMLYCVENIGGIDYVIAAGAIDATYDESGMLLEGIDESGINLLGKQYLSYSNYDFSNDFVVNIDSPEQKSYSGEYYSDSIYFCVDAELQKKEACSFAFYMHPVNRSDKITKKAKKFMDSYIQRVRNSLIFR